MAEIVLATMPEPSDASKASRAAREERRAEEGRRPPRPHRPRRPIDGPGRRLKDVQFRSKTWKTRAVLGLITSDKAAALLTDEVAAQFRTASSRWPRLQARRQRCTPSSACT